MFVLEYFFFLNKLTRTFQEDILLKWQIFRSDQFFSWSIIARDQSKWPFKVIALFRSALNWTHRSWNDEILTDEGENEPKCAVYLRSGAKSYSSLGLLNYFLWWGEENSVVALCTLCLKFACGQVSSPRWHRLRIKYHDYCNTLFRVKISYCNRLTSKSAVWVCQNSSDLCESVKPVRVSKNRKSILSRSSDEIRVTPSRSRFAGARKW